MEVEEASNGNIPGVPQDQVDDVVNTCVEVVKIPLISGGHFIENDNFIEIATRWSVMDVAKKERISFHRSFSVLKSSISWGENECKIDDQKIVISTSGSVPFDGKLTSISEDGTQKAILVEKKPENGNGSGTKAEWLQIWNQETLLKTYDLSELDKHKSVYSTAGLGTTMCWSKNGKKLAYLAEKKVPKTKPFFTSYVKKSASSKENGNEVKDEPSLQGEDYAFKQTWGEQLKDMYFSVIVVLDIETDNFEIIELSKDEFPTDIQWVNDVSIVGCSYKIPVYRLGLIFCTNRDSRIFKVDVDGKNLKFLSQSGRGASSPRIRPDGQYVIWQERAVDGPHDRPKAIMGLSMNQETAVPVCLYAASPANELPIYLPFPSTCWNSDGSEFFLVTLSTGISKLLSLSVKSDGSSASVNWTFEDGGVDSVLWIGKKYMLVARSSSLTTPFIELLDISSNKSPRRAVITKGKSPVPNQTVIKEFLFGESTAPSIYLGPEFSSVQPNSVPFIVFPHGGPHTSFADTYGHDTVMFLRLGFAVLKLNYIGSLGSKRDETDRLLGEIGSLDVNDCQTVAKNCLQNNPSIDPNNVFVYGGSHGGFLGAHLTSAFPEFYRAASLRNPVCDLNTMLGTTDITDWVVAESGFPLPVDIATVIPAAKSLENAEKYMKCSPTTYASKVQAATLLCLGTEDLRVPMSQGLSYYRALKAYNKIAELRIYPDNHSLLSPPVWMDHIIHSILWFKRFMKK